MSGQQDELELYKKLLGEKEKQLRRKLKQQEKQKEEFENYNDLSDSEKLNDNLKLYCKVGGKKTICIYGLHQKLPVSLRPHQWELLYQFMMSGELHQFIKENKDKLI